MKRNIMKRSVIKRIIAVVVCLSLVFTVGIINGSAASQTAQVEATAFGLSATKGDDDTKVNLSWTAVSGASYYNVYFKRGDGTREGWDAKNIITTSFTSMGNDTKQEYYTFTVYAYNSSGNEIVSNSIKYYMTTQNQTTTTLTVNAAKGDDDTKVNLSWSAVSGASYYNVYFKRGDGTREGWDAKNIKTTSFISTGNDTNQSYYTFTVYAYNSSGNEIARGIVEYTMPRKATIEIIVSATNGNDDSQVKLSWPAVYGASYYNVYYKRGDGTKEGWDVKNIKTTSFTSTGNDTKQSYYTFTVYAYNASGNEIANGSIKYNMHIKENASFTVSATKGDADTQVKLSWSGAFGASYYSVYYKRGDGTKEGWDAKNIKTTSFISTGNDTKQEYYTFTVYAYNSSGNEIASGSVKYEMSPVSKGGGQYWLSGFKVYQQYDYNNSGLSSSGCGPTSLANAIRYKTSCKGTYREVSPLDVYNLAKSIGLFGSGGISIWGMVSNTTIQNKYHFKASNIYGAYYTDKKTDSLKKTALDKLKTGSIFLVSAPNSYYRSGGSSTTYHVVAITGYSDGKVLVLDSANNRANYYDYNGIRASLPNARNFDTLWSKITCMYEIIPY